MCDCRCRWAVLVESTGKLGNRHLFNGCGAVKSFAGPGTESLVSKTWINACQSHMRWGIVATFRHQLPLFWRQLSLGPCTICVSISHSKLWRGGPMWAEGNPPFPPYPFTSPPSTLSFSIFYFSLFSCLTLFVYFLAFPSLPILPEYSHSVSRPDVVGGD